MERDDITEFLKKMRGDQQASNEWDKIIQPNSSYLIVGDVGTGKSALAYYLLETFSQKYDLLPAVVGFPRDKRALLPDNFALLDEPSQCTELENAIIFIDEADLQLPLEDSKARKYVVNFLSLPRHRKQIFLLAFHYPRLVMSRYLPFFSAFLLKRPPYLIEFASKSKGDALNQMMERAEERFAELPGEDVVKRTYVVAPRIRWQGMLDNPLCSFWGKELSEVWAGAEIEESPAFSTRYKGEYGVCPMCHQGIVKLIPYGYMGKRKACLVCIERRRRYKARVSVAKTNSVRGDETRFRLLLIRYNNKHGRSTL